ncbi:MAG TPA: hypothetical protein VFI74_05295 [Candidatus Saccharimonadales bacterium]|nr:hypothetical protein [Candidatus Saccharimonadales bacterium]
MALGKQDAVDMLNALIYAELSRLKLSASVSVPFEIDIPDGGIDGTLEGLEDEPASQLLLAGETYYQSKAGDSVGISKGALKDIIFEDTTPKKDRKLKPKIRAIAESNGNLVLFLPGISKPKEKEAEKDLLDIIRETVPDTTLRVKILQADKIVGILKPHLALGMRLLRGNTNFSGATYDMWEIEQSMSNHFAHDEQRDAQIENIRALMRDDNVNDVRVSGFPGNGKTRSVLEALRPTELSSQVLYFSEPSLAIDSNNLREISYQDGHKAIIVIDECDRPSHAAALAIITRSKSDLKLVTIYNEDGNEIGSNVKYVDLNTSEKLSEDAIKRIIESYGPADEDAGRWAQYCDGSPRMAHMIGENLKFNSTDILKNPGYDEAMELCIANRDQIGSDAFDRRKRVLMWLSLFTKFGWSKVHEDERRFILAKIARFENLSEGEVEAVVAELRERKILQGDKTLYISPRLLQIRAWKWWWEKYRDRYDPEKFWQEKDSDGDIEVGDELKNWFNDMFQYAAEAPGAAEVVKKLLAPGGPLEKEDQLIAAIENNFFLKLTEANPEAALILISRWMQTKSDEELTELNFDRQRLVRPLEAMAVWKDHFVEATRLLLRLARTETNHTYSNNSEGVFTDMFSNGYGKVATTEAAPPDRVVVLKEALGSENPKEVKLAIKAIYKSLETDSFTKVVGPEIQGLKREPKLWMPETYGEFWDAMQLTWDLLVQRIPTLDDELLHEAVKVVTDRLRGLIRLQAHGLKYLNDFIELTDKGYVSYEEALKTVSLIMRYESSLKDDIRARLEEFYASLEGSDFDGKLKRYIATNVMEDWWGDSGEEVDTTQQKIEELAEEIISNPFHLLDNKWLFTAQAKNGFRLGLVLAEMDKSFELLPTLLTEQKKANHEDASVFFLAGYMQNLRKVDQDKAHQTLDEMKEDEYFLPHLLEIIWRTTLDEHTGKLVLELLKSDQVNYKEMATFKLGGAVKDISDVLFDQWMENLLNRNDVTAHTTAIDLFLTHYVFNIDVPLPQKLTKKLLSKKTLGSQATRQISSDIEWDWSQIALRYIQQYPDDVEFLIDFMAKYFGRKNSILESHHEATKVLTELAKLKPQIVWERVAEQLSQDRYDTWGLENWLQGEVSFGEDRGHGAIDVLDQQFLIDWIDKDPKNRAPLVARMVPHDFGFDNKENEQCWLQIILTKYGNDPRVESAVNSNLWSEGFSGPASQHYAAKLEDVKRFKAINSQSSNIQNWANKYIPALEEQVEQSKIREERESF